MLIEGWYEGNQPFISLNLRGESIKAIVDTGFDGSLMLPQKKIDQWNLPAIMNGSYQTADGRISPCSIYAMEIDWMGEKQLVDVDPTQGEFTLVGMSLLSPCRIEMEPSRGILRISK